MRNRSELVETHPPEYQVQSWPTAFETIVNSKSMLSTILKDCAASATARAQLAQGDYSHGTTFWVGAKEKPKTSLERLALDVFYSHVNREAGRWSKMELASEGKRWTIEDVDLDQSGAEWWTLYMDGEDGGVGWHWDKDYHAELEQGDNIHPFFGTVSYFSEIGAPTVVFPKTTVGPKVSSDDYTYDEFPISKAYISRPVSGKHIYFDGRLLHGAPIDFYDLIRSQLQTTKGTHRGPRPKRATLLVNVWINHKPHDAVSVCSQSSLQSKLSKLAVSLDLSRHIPSLPLEVAVLPPGNDKHMTGKKNKNKQNRECKINADNIGRVISTSDLLPFSWELNEDYTMFAEMPVNELAACWSHADTLLVHWRKGTRRPYIAESIS